MISGPENNWGITPGRTGPLRSVDVLDDTDIPAGSDYLWADTRPDWPAIATDRAATIIRQTQELRQTSRALREALMQRDLWSVLAFAVGVVCGVGLAVLW